MEIFAPAKINLSLAICARRNDGYHLLDSLVGFLDFGDHLHITPASASSLQVFGNAPTENPQDNLALQALRRLEAVGVPPHKIILHKHIFVGAGLGGGSSDAAAVLRALGQNIPTPMLHSIAQELGADVPVCLFAQPARMTGIGEIITPVDDFPIRHLVLIAPPMTLSTQQVFAQQQQIHFSQHKSDATDPETWSNGLEKAACALCPELVDILAYIRQLPHLIFASMSGSGVCCYAALPCPDTQKNATKLLQTQFPTTHIRNAKLLKAKDIADG